MAYADLEKRKMWQRLRWYKRSDESKAKQKLSQKRIRDNVRAWYKNYKATLACQECGENHPRCIEFHHKNPSSKNGEPHIADKLGSWSIKRIMLEISKCAVLCANCHRKVHAASDELFGVTT